MKGRPYEIQDQDEAGPPEPNKDLAAIRLGVLAAEANDREIDDGTARRIALQLDVDEATALYDLAASGSVDEQHIYREINEELERQHCRHLREWLTWLGTYCVARETKGPVDGWRDG
jgi:hypothetical protein